MDHFLHEKRSSSSIFRFFFVEFGVFSRDWFSSFIVLREFSKHIFLVMVSCVDCGYNILRILRLTLQVCCRFLLG